MTGTWPDQPASADTAVEQLEVHHARGREYTDEEWAGFDRRHVGRTVRVEHGVCGTCGQPVVYNLAAKVVAHTSDAVDPCEWPWPGVPMPDHVKAEIEFWRNAGKAMDGWLAGQPTASAPALGVNEVRTDAEVLRIAAAQADARRARAEHSAVDIRPGSVSDLLRERLGAQVARRAERAGRLPLSSD